MRRAAHLLIVEDDEGIGANLQRALAGDDVDAAWVHTIAEAEALARVRPPDLVLLDLGLPDGDGIELCRTLLAAQPALPILILTARDTEIDVVIGLDSGAVDYVTKPFRLAELSARIRTHLRRVARDDDRIVVGDLVVDRAARVASVAGVDVELRAKEFDLLGLLAGVAGSALRREDLMAEVWDEHWFGSTKTLDVTVSTLRRKLDAAAPGAVTITTLRGVGYRLERP
ncbi:MAG TPA: response regulator transcription factor [Acidimicrobiia bacterium]|nr:response regulator transcription factor [Acidimicrobiia bacterium]